MFPADKPNYAPPRILETINPILDTESFIFHRITPLHVQTIVIPEYKGKTSLLILCIGAVLAAEGVNSAIEALCDKVSPEYDEAIKHTKDLAAGAVLILAVMSVIVGLLIFVPKVLSLFH